MKTVSLRSFYRDAPDISVPVLIVHGSRVIGRYTPAADIDWPEVNMEVLMEKQVPVTPVVKEIQKEAPKVERGKISKGLGDLPGSRDPYKEFKPVPKK